MAMGGGGSTYRSADGIWHAAIDIEPDRATGRRRRLTAQGKTKAVANARLRMKLDAYVRKGLTPNSPSPRLMDWLETWYHERAEANLRPNSRRSYENAIARLNRIAGARRIGSLGHEDMAAIQDGLKCYSPKTATITWSVLKNALEAARDENLIRRNPAKMVRPVSGRRRPMKVLSPAQAAELIRNEPDPMWRLNWLLAFATGLRQGERLGLTMDELTTLNGRRALVIDHQLQRVPDSRRADWPLGEDVTDLGNGFWLCPPKTDSGERIVVLDDVMCGALDEWLAIRKQKGVDSPMLFVTGRGTPIDRRIEYFHWDKALLRIGIVNGEDGVRLRPHSARHTADTLFANAGVPESARLALMGQRRRDGQRVPARGHRGFAEGQRGRDRCAEADRLVPIYKGPARRSPGRSFSHVACPPCHLGVGGSTGRFATHSSRSVRRMRMVVEPA